jgi:hypothetical protein
MRLIACIDEHLFVDEDDVCAPASRRARIISERSTASPP